ncbi:MAG TPA: serine/threonine-protein kinase [Polyangiaceae bacterium]
MTLPNVAAEAQGPLGKLVADRYRIEALIGMGGMSAVYRATDRDGEPRALKLLFPELIPFEAKQRFEREASMVSGLSHAHVVPALAAGFSEELGTYYLVMPLLNGLDVDALLEKLGALDPVAAVRMALQAARGIGAAHRIGVVHRDVKPSNLMLDRDGEQTVVKVADFGIAKRLSSPEQSLTTTGARLGSPDYASPEQLQDAKHIDERADIWGLGATLYHMLSGLAPFSHLESLSDLIEAICSDDVPHIQDRAPWVEPKLAKVVHRALNRDPNRRYATMEDFADALRPFSENDEQLAEARITAVASLLRHHSAPRAVLGLESERPPPMPQKLADPLALEGQSLSGRYRVRSLIGKGGMGSVYEVEDERGALFAAKVISTGMTGAAPNALQRFAREARAASDIASEYVVRTVDTGTDERLAMPFIIMERLHGVELSSVLKKHGALEPEVAVRLVLQAASGVAAAHARGVIHRDIKPANLFLDIDADSCEVTVKVCDFGVAKRSRMNEPSAISSHFSLTRTGGMLGSPMYMSPEQTKNAKSVDERSDVWSLSVVLWEALSGQRLWGGQTSLGELIIAICTEPIAELDVVAPWIRFELARAVHCGLERDPNERYQTVNALIEALEPFAGGSRQVLDTELVGMSDEARSQLEVKVLLTDSAQRKIKNLAKGGRGDPSLPPARGNPPSSPRASTQPDPSLRASARASTQRPQRATPRPTAPPAASISLRGILLTAVLGMLAALAAYFLARG